MHINNDIELYCHTTKNFVTRIRMHTLHLKMTQLYISGVHLIVFFVFFLYVWKFFSNTK